MSANGRACNVAVLARLQTGQRAAAIAALLPGAGNRALARLVTPRANAVLARVKLVRFGTDTGPHTKQAKYPRPPDRTLDDWCKQCLKKAEIEIDSSVFEGIDANEMATYLAAEAHAQETLGVGNEFSPFLSFAQSAAAAAAAKTIDEIVRNAESLYEVDVPDEFIVPVGNSISALETETLVALPRGYELKWTKGINPYLGGGALGSLPTPAAASSSSAPVKVTKGKDAERAGDDRDDRERPPQARPRREESSRRARSGDRERDAERDDRNRYHRGDRRGSRARDDDTRDRHDDSDRRRGSDRRRDSDRHRSRDRDRDRDPRHDEDRYRDRGRY